MTKIKKMMCAAILKTIFEGMKAGEFKDHPDVKTFLEKSGRGWAVIESFIDRIGNARDAKSFYIICLNQLIEDYGMNWDVEDVLLQNEEDTAHVLAHEQTLAMLEQALANGLSKDLVMHLVEGQAETDLCNQLVKRGHKDLVVDEFKLVFEYCADVSSCDGAVTASDWSNNAATIDELVDLLDEELRDETQAMSEEEVA